MKTSANNRKFTILAGIVLVIALLSAVGVKTIFTPCVHEDGSFGACHWAGQALFAMNLLLAAQSLCTLLFTFRNLAAAKGLFLAMTLTAVAMLFIPGPVISLCMMASMRCRALMRPAMSILAAAAAAVSLAGYFLTKTDRQA